MTTEPVPVGPSPPPGTLGQLLVAFSSVTSVGLGLGTDHGIRTCYIGTAVADELELGPARTSDLYYVALTKDGGCSCGATQMAEFLGADEREAIADMVLQDTDNELAMLRWLFRHAGRGGGWATRARRAAGALVHGARFEHDVRLEECEVAQRVTERLGLGAEVAAALTACTERWDGKGQPRGLRGDAIPLVARIINLSAAVEISDRLSSRDTALALVRRRSGRAFDPAIADAFLAVAERDEFWARLDDDGLREHVRASEPTDHRLPAERELRDRFVEVVADIVDLRRPATAGHARRVAQLVQGLGERAEMRPEERTVLRHAALIHDVGLMAVSARALNAGSGGIAYRSHPLAPAALLEDVPALEQACALAAQHHERLDGSGYPAGAGSTQLSAAARMLATACAFDELTEGHLESATEALAALARGGFDGGVLAGLATGLGLGMAVTPRVVAWPAGLTAREVEVLRLGATGLSVRQIAERLVISPHTARHHLESAYAKIGVTTRAASALFAAEHGLLD